MYEKFITILEASSTPKGKRCLKIQINIDPVPWSAPKFCRGRTFSKHGSFKKALQDSLKACYKGEMLKGALRCDLTFYLVDTSKKGYKEEYHIKKPDRSNLCKLLEDCLEKVFFKNDSAIVAGDVRKEKGIVGKTEIILTEL